MLGVWLGTCTWRLVRGGGGGGGQSSVHWSGLEGGREEGGRIEC